MRNLPLRTLLLLVSCSPLLSQHRSLVVGRVLAADGAPLANAAVTLLGRPLNWTDAFGPLDRIELAADARGRFKAKVLTTVAYSAFATGGETADGLRRVTSVAERVCAGSLATLREADPVVPLRLQLEGVAPWQDLGPFRLRVVLPTITMATVDVPLDDQRRGVLPPVPTSSGYVGVVVLDRRGEPVQHARLHVTLKRPKQARHADKDVHPIRLFAPVEVPVRVLDDKGKPVAGAVIRHRIHRGLGGDFGAVRFAWSSAEDRRRVGTTGADGTCVAKLALGKDPFTGRNGDVILEASKAGFARSHSGWTWEGMFVDGLKRSDGKADAAATTEGAKKKDPELRFTLAAAQPLRGRILAGPDVPAAGLDVLLHATSKIRSGGGGWTHLDRTYVMRTDAEGRYHVDDLPLDAYDFELAALAPADVRSRRYPDRPARNGFPLLTLPPLMGRQLAIPDVDLSKTAEVSIAVLDATGGPPQDCFAVVVPIKRRLDYTPDMPWEFQLVLGRASIHLSPGNYRVVVVAENGWSTRTVRVSGENTECPLKLRAFAQMPGRAVGKSGPVAGARVSIKSTSRSNSGKSSRILQSLVHGVNQRLIPTRTDAEGRFVCRFIQQEGLRYGLKVGGSSQRVQLQESDEEIEVQIVE